MGNMPELSRIWSVEMFGFKRNVKNNNAKNSEKTPEKVPLKKNNSNNGVSPPKNKFRKK